MKTGVVIVCLGALVITAASFGRRSSTFDFRLSGYANNVRVVPPLVGDFQLGVAKIEGSGTVSQTRFDGTFSVTSDPLKQKYPKRWLKGKVVTWAYNGLEFPHGTGHSNTLTLTVQITSSSNPTEECAPGLTGRLAITDSTKTLSNGQLGDTITLGHWSGKCATFVMGWSNEDGGIRTQPQHGGPGGGQRAFVSLDRH